MTMYSVLTGNRCPGITVSFVRVFGSVCTYKHTMVHAPFIDKCQWTKSVCTVSVHDWLDWWQWWCKSVLVFSLFRVSALHGPLRYVSHHVTVHFQCLFRWEGILDDHFSSRFFCYKNLMKRVNVVVLQMSRSTLLVVLLCFNRTLTWKLQAVTSSHWSSNYCYTNINLIMYM